MTDRPYLSNAVPRAHWLVRSPAAYALILLFGLALYLPGLRSIPAIDRDEARFAQSSRQMLNSGDYVHIRLQDQARLKKPVGIYWLQAAATALAGGEDPANPIWTYRLPSLIGALGTILATLAIGRRWLGAEAGFLGAALLASCLLLGVEARQAKTDAFLLLTILLAMAALAEVWIPGKAAPVARGWRWAGFWVALGAGILIKGPVILMVAGTAAAVLSVQARSIAWLGRLRPWPGVLITAAIALPWLVAITISTHGAFLTQSVGGDMAPKLVGAVESHGAPPGAYLALFPVTFWPGSLFAFLALPWIWRARRDPAVIFCLAWIAPSWLILEMLPTKLPHYVLPLYPAIALLTGAAVSDRMIAAAAMDWRRWLMRSAIVLWSLAGLGLGILTLAAAPLGDGRLSAGGIVAAFALWGTTGLVALLCGRGDRVRAVAAAMVGATLGWGLVFGAALPALKAPWVAPRLKEALFEKLPAGHGPILIAGYGEPSAVIAFGSDLRFGSGEDAARLVAERKDAVVIVGQDQAASFNAGLSETHTGVETLGSVSGFNYANGKRVRLTLWRNAQ